MSESRNGYFLQEGKEVQREKDAYRNMILNTLLIYGAEKMVWDLMAQWQVKLAFSLDRFWFCLTGLKKAVYYGVYGKGPEVYAEIYARFRILAKEIVENRGYQADLFMLFEGDTKQMVVLFSPGEAPQCTPEELAEKINAMGQKVCEEELFQGDARYCNVTALSAELHGYSDIKVGYVQTRRLNDLSFFRMEPEVLTAEKVAFLRNEADYRMVMGECHQLQQALDEGDTELCRKRIESLFLKTVKGSYRWTLLRDVLSYCKHMLELRCTVRGLAGVELEKLCEPESYLRIEECVEALWPILEKLCALVREQGLYQDLMLRAVYYIKLHYAEDLALTDVAGYTNVSPNYLSGAFQREMGVTLREYITAERMEAAKALLTEGDLRVQDVAEGVGIHDVKYFTRLFKKTTGMTPGEYREQGRAANSRPHVGGMVL